MSTEKKLAVITGAAQGLGYAIAEELASSGHHVVLLDRNEKQLQTAVETLRSAGYDASGKPIDLSQTDEIPAVLTQIHEECGSIHVLVNNAGVNVVKPMNQVTSAEWDFVMDINLKAVFFMTQAAAPFLSDGASIVNISSVAANSPRPLSVAYAASKAGVLSLTKTASIVLAPRGIRVNAVCPGAMETELLAKMAEDMSELSGQSASRSLQNYIGDIPLGRVSAPGDVAKTVAFLASDMANYITGQSLNVCGGWTVK
ncbi:SDR family oxidoreductase [Brevibacillus ruminantium]|uniref:SDR family oxidoreductase n=1 Tax=Brevibacillus ruminantium TaxID=2950604 RepID=A0ABY4WEJ9_9BACL|nr:SDR family NAD(P)-dependent oxidoreductase [Brevibacillus ruminantium]USG65600.1 SDR family oxidoreductase [Brevibacillus ruminantium]